MGRVIVKKNACKRVMELLPHELDKGVDDTAKALSDFLKTILWRDTGTLVRTTNEHPEGEPHAEVWVGENRGHAFYVRFLEWGTTVPNAFGIVFAPGLRVTNAAHMHEPILVKNVAEGVRRACRV